MSLTHKLFINGKFEDSKNAKEVKSPFDGKLVAKTFLATPAQLEKALQAAHDSFQIYRKTSAYTRARLLAKIADGISSRRKEIANVIMLESGKPIANADIEVGRAIQTFTLASEEAKRTYGEVMPVDLDPAARAYAPAVVKFVPRGPVLAISPFNFPINLAAHKVAPALAAGCSVLLKPPPQAPGAAMVLAEIFEIAANEVADSRDPIPLSTFQVIHAENDVMAPAISDARTSTLSFTGSDKVGFQLQKLAVGKKVALELGGNAAVIVNEDADLSRAAARCAVGSFGSAGQVCIKVQRIFVHKKVAQQFETLFLAETAKIKSGDPSDNTVLNGPLIDNHACERILAWIDEAKKNGAKVLTGGVRTGNVISPTIMTHVKNTDKIQCEEVFGPVVALETFDTAEEVTRRVNESRFGLQAGIFSDSEKFLRTVGDGLEVGGVIINDISSFRADNMPYGGVKDSGLGREGLRYAIEEFSERKVTVTFRG